MYKKLKTKKWRFFNGSKFPMNGVDSADEARYLEIAEQIKMLEEQGILDGMSDPAKSMQAVIPQVTTEEDGAEGIPGVGGEEAAPKFGAQDYVAGIGAAVGGLQTANEDGKITSGELSDTGLETAAAMAGPMGQIANTAISVGENLLGDEMNQDLGEGVEYEKTGYKMGKGALQGAALGAKVGGPVGAAIGGVAGAAMGVIGQGKAKRAAMKEFEKRRNERIATKNKQSRNIYADQLQNYYKKGGKAIIKIKEANKGKFTAHCKSEGYDGVTQDCINKGMKSTSDSLRKQAIFANNVRQFNK